MRSSIVAIGIVILLAIYLQKKQPPILEVRDQKTTSISQRNPSSAPPNPSQRPVTTKSSENLNDFLKRKSSLQTFEVTRDERKGVIRVTGLKVPDVLNQPSLAQKFAIEYAQADGFRTPLNLLPSQIDTGAIQIQHFDQLFGVSPSFPVFQASIRLLGSAGNVAMIQPQLKEVDPQTSVEIALSSADAIGIAKANSNDSNSDYEIDPSQPHTIYADRRPHQLVTRVLTKGSSSHPRLLLIGHKTKTVVESFELSHH